MKNNERRSKTNILDRQTGITLLELMIVVAIVAIISAIAYPSYTQFVVKTKRAAATAFTVNGTLQLGQYVKDTDCGTLTLTNAGVKGQSGSGDKCW